MELDPGVVRSYIRSCFERKGEGEAVWLQVVGVPTHVNEGSERVVWVI